MKIKMKIRSFMDRLKRAFKVFKNDCTRSPGLRPIKVVKSDPDESDFSVFVNSAYAFCVLWFEKVINDSVHNVEWDESLVRLWNRVAVGAVLHMAAMHVDIFVSAYSEKEGSQFHDMLERNPDGEMRPFSLVNVEEKKKRKLTKF